MNYKSGTTIIIVLFFLASCGAKKKVMTTNKQIIVEHPQKKPHIRQLKPIKTKAKTTTQHTVAYIKKFAPIAIQKMKEYRIPASITLAQGILESGSGRSSLAVRSNNHFGIKCHNDWKGKRVTHDDDERGECFRRYKYPESSYEDHSKFLSTRKRYAKLFKLKHTDYKGWAYGLKRAGYATDSRYPQKLIGLIHNYNLVQYDKTASLRNPRNTIENYYKVQKGDTLYSIAKRYQTSVQKIKEINGLQSNQIDIGQHLWLP